LCVVAELGVELCGGFDYFLLGYVHLSNAFTGCSDTSPHPQ